jgi:hypothetical protein
VLEKPLKHVEIEVTVSKQHGILSQYVEERESSGSILDFVPMKKKLFMCAKD